MKFSEWRKHFNIQKLKCVYIMFLSYFFQVLMFYFIQQSLQFIEFIELIQQRKQPNVNFNGFIFQINYIKSNTASISKYIFQNKAQIKHVQVYQNCIYLHFIEQRSKNKMQIRQDTTKMVIFLAASTHKHLLLSNKSSSILPKFRVYPLYK